MRRFLQNIIIFLAVVLLLGIFGDYAISKGLRRTERGHFFTMNALMNDSINADVVILGNSRAACSYHPIIIDSILKCNSVNIGVSGQPFGVSYLRWQLYKRHNLPPKLLIINIDYGELDVVSNGFEKEQYYPYIQDTLVKPYLGLFGFSWMEKKLPMYRYRGNYKLMGIGITELLHIRHDKKGDYIKGYSNRDWNWDGEKLETVLKRGEVKCRCNPQAVTLLKEMLVETKENGIKTIFVYAPLYYKLKDNLCEAESNEVYQKLSLEYGIPIGDFSSMNISVDTFYFKDANHLNSYGAEVFSIELARFIDSLSLISGY